MLNTDSTNSICVLLLSDREYLSKEEASRYLRLVSWNQRGRRFISTGQPGSFQETDILVKNDIQFPKTSGAQSSRLKLPGWKDAYGTNGASGTGISFGGDGEGKNSIVVKLSDFVLEFYAKAGLKYLHEIRIAERVSGQLKDGQYHLFWNNQSNNENVVSSEMKLLIEKFAFPVRRGLGSFWNSNSKFLMNEYEYEHGSLQMPYKQDGAALIRQGILHPLFIQRNHANNNRVAHLTDLHVSVRENLYEANLKRYKQKNPSANFLFNNWNSNFQEGYRRAKSDSDILVLTGDLIDYGRGHMGPVAADKAGNDSYYQTDRNWFLFYYLLASGNSYQKPVYTLLGNHDWRINPYPPFAPGAPGFNSYFHNHTSFSKADERTRIIQAAHGPGHERIFSYQINAAGRLKFAWRYIKDKFLGRDLWSRLPLATTVDSIKWYLLAINPFFDYSCSLPGGQKLLMLDWAEKESLFFDSIYDGKAWSTLPWDDDATMTGPKAKNALTPLQKRMVEDFVTSSGTAKIIGMHAPPIAPYPEWKDKDVLLGRIVYDNDKFRRGPKVYKVKYPDGSYKFGHPIYAINPVADHEHYGMTADYNSFEKEREWFIKRIGDPRSGVRVVLAGHIHRNGLYFLHTFSPAEKKGPELAGKTIVDGRLFPPGDQVRKIGLNNFKKDFPLYLNTTSLGPRGNFHARKLTASETKNGGLSIDPGYSIVDLSNNGIVNQIEFRSIGVARPSSIPSPLVPSAGFQKRAVV